MLCVYKINVLVSERKSDDNASTTQSTENIVAEVESADGGSDGVSSEGEKAVASDGIQVNVELFKLL